MSCCDPPQTNADLPFDPEGRNLEDCRSGKFCEVCRLGHFGEFACPHGIADFADARAFSRGEAMRLHARAQRFAKSLGKAFFQRRENGKLLITQSQKDARLAVCERCLMLETPSGVCLQCGCYTALKAWLSTESCPLDKWSRL